MQIYNIETKAIISGEEIKELDDCFILQNVDEISNNTDTLMMRITLKNVKNKSLLIYNKQNKTTYIDCWFISSRFLDQAIEDYLTNKED